MTQVPIDVNIQVTVGSTPPPVDTVPAKITSWGIIDEITGGDARITLSPPAPDDGGQPITQYLYDKDSDDVWRPLGAVLGSYVESGFTDGVQTQVRVIARNSVGDSLPSDPLPVTTSAAGTASITLTVNRGPVAGQVAPEGIWYETAVTGFDTQGPTGGENYDARLHHISYKVTFGDVGVHSVLSGLPIEHQDKNVLFAPRGSHTFENPGTYDITVVATDRSGNTATDTVQITVGDPDALITGTNNVAIALNGDYTGAPAGAQTFNTFAAGLAAYQALSSQGKLWLKRDDVHTINYEISPSANQSWRMGAYGSGSNKPILRTTIGSTGKMFWLKGTRTYRDVALSGIRFEGGYDEMPGDANGSLTGLKGQEFFRIDNPVDVVISDCEIHGFALGVYPTSKARRVFINNIQATSMGGGFSLFAGAARLATLGINGWHSYRHAGADGWYGPKSNVGNEHGCGIRHSALNICISGVNIFTKSAWSSSPWGVDQPCIRDNTISNQNNCYAWYERGRLEGGTSMINSINSEGSPENVAGNRMAQMIHMMGNFGSQGGVTIGYGGWTVRDCIFMDPAATANPWGGAGFGGFVKVNITGNNQENRDSPVEVYNNVCGSLRDDTQAGGNAYSVFSNGGFNNTLVVNNIEYAPNRSGGNQKIADNPLSQTQLFTPRYLGFVQWSHNSGNIDATYLTPANSGIEMKPTVGSAAIGSGTNACNLYDFYGAERAATKDRGPFKVT